MKYPLRTIQQTCRLRIHDSGSGMGERIWGCCGWESWYRMLKGARLTESRTRMKLSTSMTLAGPGAAMTGLTISATLLLGGRGMMAVG